MFFNVKKMNFINFLEVLYEKMVEGFVDVGNYDGVGFKLGMG